MAVLHPLNDSRANIQQIVFSPLATYGRQTWVILYDDKHCNWKNLPPMLINKILELNKNGRITKSIGLAINGGGVGLWADNNKAY